MLVLTSCGSTANGGQSDIIEIDLEGTRLDVWLADEAAERRRGLSEMEELPSGVDGMLFVFPSPASSTFNMEDVLFPLDIWWFDPDMTLIGRTLMEPCTTSDCTSYGSPGEIRWALETPAGARDFEIGSRLSIVDNG